MLVSEMLKYLVNISLFIFYAGRLSEEEISRKEEDQSLYEFGGDLFKNELTSLHLVMIVR